MLNMECGARSEVASLQNRSVINLQHPPCGPSITIMLRELDMLRYSAGRRHHAAFLHCLVALPKGISFE